MREKRRLLFYWMLFLLELFIYNSIKNLGPKLIRMSDGMKTEHLRYFVEVVRCKSINKAAKKLMVSQPTVSSTIKALENNLGFKLIERSSQGVSLTGKGRVVFEDAKKILDMEKYWRSLDENNQPIGAVNMTAVPSSMALVLHVVSLLRQSWPLIDVIIHDCKKSNLLNLLRQQIATIGVYGFMDEELKDVEAFASRYNYRMEVLATDFFCVFIGAAHPLACKRHITLSDLKMLPAAIYAGEDPVAPFFLKYFKENECYYMNNLDAMMNFALNDNVAAVCTNLYVQHSLLVQQGLLKILDIEEFQVPFNYCLLYPSLNLLPNEAVVVNQLRAEFQG